MTTKHRAEVLAELIDGVDEMPLARLVFAKEIKEASTLLRTIPVLEDEIESLKLDVAIKDSQLVNCHKRIDELVWKYESTEI
jgi:hypothetical protein